MIAQVLALLLAAPVLAKGGPSVTPASAHRIQEGQSLGSEVIEETPSSPTDTETPAADSAAAQVDDSTPTAAAADAPKTGFGSPLNLTPFKPGATGSVPGDNTSVTGGGVHVDPIAAQPKAPVTPMQSSSQTTPPSAPSAVPAAPPVALTAPVDNSGPCPEDQYQRRLWKYTDKELDLSQASMMNNPANLAGWPATARITNVSFASGQMSFQFDKADGAGRWPDTPNTPSMGPLQYTLGIAEYINGQWYASAAIQYWHGRDQTAPLTFKKDWYYAADRWGAMCYHQPIPGEVIGVFVVAGNLRNVKDDGSLSPLHERSDVVLVPMPSANGAASFDFK